MVSVAISWAQVTVTSSSAGRDGLTGPWTRRERSLLGSPADQGGDVRGACTPRVIYILVCGWRFPRKKKKLFVFFVKNMTF